MFVEIEDVFGENKTVINTDFITEINKDRFYVRTADGEKHGVKAAMMQRILQMVEAESRIRP